MRLKSGAILEVADLPELFRQVLQDRSEHGLRELQYLQHEQRLWNSLQKL